VACPAAQGFNVQLERAASTTSQTTSGTLIGRPPSRPSTTFLAHPTRVSYTRRSAAHWWAIPRRRQHGRGPARYIRGCVPHRRHHHPCILKAATHNWERQRRSDAWLKVGIAASQPRLSTFQHYPIPFVSSSHRDHASGATTTTITPRLSTSCATTGPTIKNRLTSPTRYHMGDAAADMLACPEAFRRIAGSENMKRMTTLRPRRMCVTALVACVTAFKWPSCSFFFPFPKGASPLSMSLEPKWVDSLIVGWEEGYG
jgi:hypothetical protein